MPVTYKRQDLLTLATLLRRTTAETEKLLREHGTPTEPELIDFVRQFRDGAQLDELTLVATHVSALDAVMAVPATTLNRRCRQAYFVNGENTALTSALMHLTVLEVVRQFWQRLGIPADMVARPEWWEACGFDLPDAAHTCALLALEPMVGNAYDPSLRLLYKNIGARRTPRRARDHVLA